LGIEVGDFRGGVEVWRKAGGHQLNTNTPETTKPLHFCRGFVLYGAAPGVEFIFNYLPAMVFMKVNIRFYL
jgi:hypothetical protein